MRNPKFGNKFKFQANTRIHRNLSGELRVFQGNIPTWEGFSVTYEALNPTDLQTVETFLLTSAGNLVTFEDFEGRTWTGVVTSPTIDIVEGRMNLIKGTNGSIISDQNPCNWTISFEFEGQVTGTIKAVTSNQPFNPNISVGLSNQILVATPTFGNTTPITVANTTLDAMTASGALAQNGQTVVKISDETTAYDLTGIGIFNSTGLDGQPGVVITSPFTNTRVLSVSYPYTAYAVGKSLYFGNNAKTWYMGVYQNKLKEARFGNVVNTTTEPDDFKTHLYYMTFDGNTLNFYVDGLLIQSIAGTDFTAPSDLYLNFGTLGEYSIANGVPDEDSILAQMQNIIGIYQI